MDSCWCVLLWTTVTRVLLKRQTKTNQRNCFSSHCWSNTPWSITDLKMHSIFSEILKAVLYHFSIFSSFYICTILGSLRENDFPKEMQKSEACRTLKVICDPPRQSCSPRQPKYLMYQLWRICFRAGVWSSMCRGYHVAEYNWAVHVSWEQQEISRPEALKVCCLVSKTGLRLAQVRLENIIKHKTIICQMI